MLNEYVFLKWAEKAFEAKKIYIFSCERRLSWRLFHKSVLAKIVWWRAGWLYTFYDEDFFVSVAKGRNEREQKRNRQHAAGICIPPQPFDHHLAKMFGPQVPWKKICKQSDLSHMFSQWWKKFKYFDLKPIVWWRFSVIQVIVILSVVLLTTGLVSVALFR